MSSQTGQSRLSKDWRQRNPVAAPDRGFVKQLKKLNENFEVVWDAGSDKWEIWEFPRDKAGYHVTTIQTVGKSYRELGQDILLQMQKMLSFNFDAEKIMDYLLEADRQERRRKKDKFTNEIADIARETFNYAHNVLQVSVPAQIEVPKTQMIGRVVRNETAGREI